MKILIAVPCQDKIDTHFVRCLCSLERVGETSLQLLANSLVYVSREELSKTAVENGADYLLFLDSDMTFNSSLLRDLLKAAEEEKADVVTALAFRRRPPYTPCIWQKIRIGGNGENEVVEFNEIPTGRAEIDACGMAGCLIKTEIIQRVVERYHAVFQPLPAFGEDLSFCIRAKQCGAKIIVDTAVKMGHLSQMLVDESVYYSYIQTGGKTHA